MSWFYQAYFIVPSSRLTEGQFARTLDLLRGLPRTRIPPWRPSRPKATLFTTTMIPDVIVYSLDLGFDASSNEDSEHLIALPPGYGFLKVSMEKWVIEESVEQQRRLLEVLKRVFVGMDALLGVVDHEFAFDHPMGLEELASVVGGVTMVSDELLGPAMGGIEVGIPGTEQLENGICIHPCEEFFTGIPKDIATKVGELLARVRPQLLAPDAAWPVIEHADAVAGGPSVEEGMPGARQAVYLQPMPGAGFFVWARYPKANHTKERARAFLEGLALAHANGSGGTASAVKWPFDRWSDQYLGGSLTAYLGEVTAVDGPYRRVSASLQARELTSRRGGAGLGPAFEREGEVGVLLDLGYHSSDLSSPEEAGLLMRIVRSLVLVFEPSFAFGHSDYNLFTDEYEAMAPPEGRVWPLVVYDTARMPPGALDRLLEDWSRVADTWALTVLRDRWAVLSVNDLRSPVAGLDGTPFHRVAAEALSSLASGAAGELGTGSPGRP